MRPKVMFALAGIAFVVWMAVSWRSSAAEPPSHWGWGSTDADFDRLMDEYWREHP